MKFTLEVEMDNDAFQHDSENMELLHILDDVNDRVFRGSKGGTIQDSNGNTVGTFSITTD